MEDKYMEKMKWDLDIIYQGYQDKRYLEDWKEIKSLIEQAKKLMEQLNQKSDEAIITCYLKLTEQMRECLDTISMYSSLRTCTNVNDMEASEELGKVQMVYQEMVPIEVAFQKWLRDKDVTKILKDSTVLKEYQFFLLKMKEASTHLLSEQEEILASKLTMVASDSWSELQSKLTSNLLIEVPGQLKKLPLSAVRNLAFDKDPVVRKNAYEAELKSYKQIEDAVAMGLNNIKREVNIMADLRGYQDAQEITLLSSNVQRKTLDAMISAIQDRLPKFRSYFKTKAQYLGHEKGLPFYDLFAPIGGLTKEYSVDEAKQTILDVYGSFSEPLKKMAENAFSQRWIDFFPKEGKVGGAFCAALPKYHQCRVLTNFTGSLSDVQTLAHELGHAYHDMVIEKNAPLNQNYPMPLAETASILCQTLMAKKMFQDMQTPMDQLTVLEQSLQEDTQCVVDILSRFLFENKVLATPIHKPLSAKEMCQMMLDAQEESYGDGLDKEFRHPYMWLCKSHYYSAGYSFYNWPYAFGLLFGKGLYKQYLKDKDSFVKNYDVMLQNTSLMPAEEVAAGMGIDITNKDFWLESLSAIEEDIDIFECLIFKSK